MAPRVGEATDPFAVSTTVSEPWLQAVAGYVALPGAEGTETSLVTQRWALQKLLPEIFKFFFSLHL